MNQDWLPGSWWFWPSFVLIVSLNLVCFLVPTSVFVLVPVELMVGIMVMRQNRTPGPHRMLGFTLGAVALTILVGTVLVFLSASVFRPPIMTVYGYQGPYMYGGPTSGPRRIAPENTDDPTFDPILAGVTETIAAATAVGKTAVWTETAELGPTEAPATMTAIAVTEAVAPTETP